MARPNIELISAIRATVSKLSESDAYQWGHMGSCNCGFLAQEITDLTKTEIHQRAMEGYGDWNEQLNDYCPTSGLSMDAIITSMLNIGLDTDDLKHLERLSDPIVLQQIPIQSRWLQRNKKEDVILYMTHWANILEETLIANITLPGVEVAETQL